MTRKDAHRMALRASAACEQQTIPATSQIHRDATRSFWLLNLGRYDEAYATARLVVKFLTGGE